MAPLLTIEAAAGDAGKRLDAFLHERLPEFSRSRLQCWIRDGRVAVDSRNLRASTLLKGGESIVVEPAAAPPLRAEPEDLPLNILYADADVLVIDKPAGMVVHAGAGHSAGTLVNALLHHFGSLSQLNGEMRPGIVHRLDKETSGVLAVARTDAAHQALAEQFQAREVEKTYLAVVQGTPKQPEGRIASPIARDPVHRTRMTTRLRNGRTAITDYRLAESFGRYSLLELHIGTGRTHQIRVHLASVGHPVVNDRHYGAAAVPNLGARFLLHARRLRFRSPSSGNWIEVESPLAEDFAAFLEPLRAAGQ